MVNGVNLTCITLGCGGWMEYIVMRNVEIFGEYTILDTKKATSNKGGFF